MKKRLKVISFLGGGLILAMIISLISPLLVVNTAQAAGLFEPLNVELDDYTVSATPTATITFTIDTAGDGTSQLVATDYILVTLEWNAASAATNKSIEADAVALVAADISLTCGATTGLETDMQDNGGAQLVTVLVTDNASAADTIKITPNAAGSFCADASDKYILTIANTTTELTNPDSADTYAVTVGTYNVGDTLLDGQSAAVVVGDSAVTISGTVDPTLTLDIYDEDTSNATTTCALGTLTTTYVYTCAYDTVISTNASSGYTAYITATANAGAAGTLATSGGDDIGVVADSAVTLANEEYGVGFQSTDTIDTGNFIEYHASNNCETGAGKYDETTTPLPSEALDETDQAYVSSAAAVDGSTTGVTTVCHGAAISGTTPAGSYSQTVTITVVGNF